MILLAGALLAFGVCASPARPYETTEQREPCTRYEPLRRAWYGDFHVHTALSLDAAMQDTRTLPEDAYRYARGEPIDIPPYLESGDARQQARIDRPLDFLGVTDHAEMLGELRLCHTRGAEGYWSPSCLMLRHFPGGFSWVPALPLGGKWFAYAASRAERLGFCGKDGAICRAAALEPWLETQRAAEAAYDRSADCQFSSFVAYEWTGANFLNGVDVANLHRNVIFRNAEVPELPSSFVETSNAPALWQHLQDECSDAAGSCDAVVIPHNSNISLGLMFQSVLPDGNPITTADAIRRQRYETLVEMIQHKGNSECYGGPGASDELCDFEQLPWNSFSGNTFPSRAQPIQPDAGFVREVLKEGMQLQRDLGVNPFKFGFIGSTDTHRSLAGGVAEKNFPGHGGAGNAGVELDAQGLPDQWEFNPGGLAVLYAEENTRDSLFAAMQRREAYATSGPRIGVRFFGGWDYDPGLCDQDDFVARGYERGVPMGADLPQAGSTAPVFAVAAVSDPGTAAAPGTELQRIQVVKGWIDDNGNSHEQVFDVAGGDNGASVDLASCEPLGSGHRRLCSVWSDPGFVDSQDAFYYARVIENPSCRWSTFVCNEQRVDCSNPDGLGSEQAQCCMPHIKKTVQERAWTSPIWYSPDR